MYFTLVNNYRREMERCLLKSSFFASSRNEGISMLPPSHIPSLPSCSLGMVESGNSQFYHGSGSNYWDFFFTLSLIQWLTKICRDFFFQAKHFIQFLKYMFQKYQTKQY